MSGLSGLQVRLWLLFICNTQCPRLSRNIIRGICIYLDRVYLHCISCKTLRQFDIETSSIKDIYLGSYSYLGYPPFDRSWVFCLVGSQTIVGVSNHESMEICLSTYTVGKGSYLCTSRGRPGLAWVDNWVYAFGGNVTHPLHSCEKYDLPYKTWKSLSVQMKTPKSCFTPCKVDKEIYLCCLTGGNQPFEAFSPVTETFRNLQVGYSSNGFGSVTFLVGDTLYIVGADDLLLKWKLSKSQLEPVQSAGLMGVRDSASSNMAPIRVGRKVGWTCFSTARLVLFDLSTETLSWGF